MENTALLKAIIAHAIDGIITIDEQGQIESMNPAGCKLFNYTPEEMIGKHYDMLIPASESDWDCVYGCTDMLTNDVIVGTGREVIGLRKGSILFPFRLGLSEVQFSGRKIYTGFIHDLSREKEAEEKLKVYAADLEAQVAHRTALLNETVKALEVANDKVTRSLEKEKELGQLKSRFISIASHEFRTPLTAIQLSSALIDKYALLADDASVTKHVNKIYSAIGDLLSILNDFLTLEKLETGKVVPVPVLFNIRTFATEITEEMQQIAKKKQQIIYQHHGATVEVFMDQTMLKNCVVNLIGNAIKYSGEDTFIKFHTEIKESKLIIRISDNGIGIPETDQKHLFEAFFRAHNTGDVSGTGLGLKIVTHFVGLMDGMVDFTSDVNQGTSFTLSFPIDHE
ncbi:MAG: PAS domain-containing sensor histidine kinase [Sphingobacteriaceae bacterium]